MPQSIRPGHRSPLPTLLVSALLSALFVFALTAVSLPGTAFASEMKLAACSLNLRTSPYTTARIKTTLKTGMRVTEVAAVRGSAYTATCNGKTISSRYWYRISGINGRSVKSLYGVSYVYGAVYLFRTPTPTVALMPSLAFYAECGGSELDSRFRALFGPGDPGDRLDTDTMGDLRQVGVANGMCTINVERKGTPSGRPFAGAAMATYGTFSQKYGTFEARLRYDEAKGTWPSFFLLPVGQKGPYPEIDVFEAYGDAACLGPGAVTSAIHYAGEATSDYKVVPVTNSSDWHVHRIVWTATMIVFSIDGVVKFSTSSHVPQSAMYPILVFGVGANNAMCRADSTTPSRLTMDVDYLRVYAP